MERAFLSESESAYSGLQGTNGGLPILRLSLATGGKIECMKPDSSRTESAVMGTPSGSQALCRHRGGAPLGQLEFPSMQPSTAQADRSSVSLGSAGGGAPAVDLHAVANHLERLGEADVAGGRGADERVLHEGDTVHLSALDGADVRDAPHGLVRDEEEVVERALLDHLVQADAALGRDIVRALVDQLVRVDAALARDHVEGAGPTALDGEAGPRRRSIRRLAEGIVNNFEVHQALQALRIHGDLR
eukprot:CAMPEP_0175313694 /NCGR_PEP_ID=MMETSP0093-20121207/68014_1 /TAXON_ID=311494 /ORGANISM="Alexandrium monilatum, Strain CCMP3105" /LENGTH=245 /DNA_ID=CAMNT_0016610405 /DNA_START=16 /DNA_END=749 /DNA_ORIENTATION=+